VPADELEAATLRSFRDAVGVVVRDVPAGRVTTYGEVAAWVGRPGAARQVGAALRSLAAEDPGFPWQRVINAQGGISTYRVGAGELQEALLRREGVEVRNGRVDLRRYRFRPTDAQA
jgi:methylated-DNA-protein-cysteine methyltransferase-like protein